VPGSVSEIGRAWLAAGWSFASRTAGRKISARSRRCGRPLAGSSARTLWGAFGSPGGQLTTQPALPRTVDLLGPSPPRDVKACERRSDTMCHDADAGTIVATASSSPRAGTVRGPRARCLYLIPHRNAGCSTSLRWLEPGQPETDEILTGDFDATLTSHGACAWLGPARYVILWPAGYQVKFHPTELIGPDGQVVAHAGQYVGFRGRHVEPGTPLPSYCGPTSDALMLEGQG
jgi:hypothetical protein